MRVRSLEFMRARIRTTTLALVAAAALLAVAAGPLAGGASSDTSGTAANKSPLAGNGMWIWYLSHSSHGKLGSIAKKAHAHGIDTVLVKSGDGTTYWNQFSANVVNGLHARGLDVCAWQFIYGDQPGKEAFDPGAQRIDETVQHEAHPWAVDRPFVAHDPQHLGVCR